jgi:hypothetical protein
MDRHRLVAARVPGLPTLLALPGADATMLVDQLGADLILKPLAGYSEPASSAVRARRRSASRWMPPRAGPNCASCIRSPPTPTVPISV